MLVKLLFMATWILAIALQSRFLPFLGAAYIIAVFLYHYQKGVIKLAVTTVIWYWFTATISLFVWLRFNLWMAGWIHVFIAWFAPIILTSIMPFGQVKEQHQS